mmetsp:Transcript_98571/g.212595  ORF Transcript_98571/g.212595 Transcript_98571/m.212595 type:complete len:407 (+) Transcript_98571:213-1433(+)
MPLQALPAGPVHPDEALHVRRRADGHVQAQRAARVPPGAGPGGPRARQRQVPAPHCGRAQRRGQQRPLLRLRAHARRLRGRLPLGEVRRRAGRLLQRAGCGGRQLRRRGPHGLGLLQAVAGQALGAHRPEGGAHPQRLHALVHPCGPLGGDLDAAPRGRRGAKVPTRGGALRPRGAPGGGAAPCEERAGPAHRGPASAGAGPHRHGGLLDAPRPPVLLPLPDGPRPAGAGAVLQGRGARGRAGDEPRALSAQHPVEDAADALPAPPARGPPAAAPPAARRRAPQQPVRPAPHRPLRGLARLRPLHPRVEREAGTGACGAARALQVEGGDLPAHREVLLPGHAERSDAGLLLHAQQRNPPGDGRGRRQLPPGAPQALRGEEGGGPAGPGRSAALLGGVLLQAPEGLP